MDRLASFAVATVAAGALLTTSVAASAAVKPKAGTFAADPAQKGVKGSRLALGVSDTGVITGVGFFWTCGSKRKTDHQTTMLDGLDDVVKPKKGAFRATRDAYTVFGSLPDVETGEAKVTISGRFTSAKTISGTVTAKMGSCSTGPLTYVATWEGPPVKGPSA